MKARPVTRALLRRLPLPPLDAAGDKESRGRVLVIGGSRLVPGAILLAGVAALRAGAGKLQLATVRTAALGRAREVPEALVVPLPQGREGEIAGVRAGPTLRDYVSGAQAVLVGPGMTAVRATHAVIAALVPRLADDATLVLDGAAITALGTDGGLLAPLGGRAVLTPHAGEMASLLGVDKRVVDDDPAGAARHAAGRFGATVALKGAETWIATPDDTLYHFRGGTVGLGTSGSGDTLAGIVVGLAARGAPATTATIWGVWAHAAAGRALSRRMGAVGFLARELLAEVPAVINGSG
jgi:ADP-dependent NAD(P)H-hydrate dehydratase